MTLSSKKYLIFSAFIWIGIFAFGIYFFINIKKYINFGIDLVGGTYLTLDVKTEESIKNALLSIIESFSQKAKKDNIEEFKIKNIDYNTGQFNLELANNISAKKTLELFKEDLQSKRYNINKDFKISQSGNNINFSLSSDFLNNIKRDAVDSNISIIRERLDIFGAGEITIFPQGENSIVIELPNVNDPERAKERIGKAALLEMKPVYDYASTEKELLDNLGSKIPEGTMIISAKEGSKEKGFYLVPIYAKVTGKLLKDVKFEIQQPDIFSQRNASPYAVNLQFNAEGAQKFYELTSENINKPVAIIIDNIVVSAPIVQTAIDSGSAIISGNFDEKSAKELVSILKSGSFAAPVEFVEERQIGPSLGQEAIYSGLLSCAISLVLLFIFSIFIYKLAGLFAFIVLIYNLLFILFAMAIIPDATLTLPGIAGMVLTLGMAIDSSILIYERIKEELNSGINIPKAVSDGFSGATSVILDANITTFIVGLVLYYFGSPAIQGFALTMMIGIVATLISGLILLRWIFNFVLNGLNLKKISI